MSARVFRLFPLLLLAAVPSASALDARNPDPISVVRAAFMAHNVGNVDASVAFYTPDEFIISSRGTRPGSIKAYVESNRDANVQFELSGDARIEGSKITSASQTTISFFDQMGLGPVDVVSIVTVEGDRIKSLVYYYPLRSVARMEQGCREHPDVRTFSRPCADFVSGARAHTSRLISEGIAAPE